MTQKSQPGVTVASVTAGKDLAASCAGPVTRIL